MRTSLDSLVTEKSLSLVNTAVSGDFPEQLHELGGLKNVCAKVSPQLVEEIDNVCSFLGISKRRFLEAALIDAVAQAHQIIEREGVADALRGSVEGAK